MAGSNITGYQWFFQGFPVFGGSNAALVISNFPITAVGNYFIDVSNAYGTVPSATAAIEIATQNQNGSPTNLSVDKFGDAVDLTSSDSVERYRPVDDTGGYTLSQSFSTVGATKEQGEPNHAGQPGGASYWYSYTATSGAAIDFNSDGSSFNTVLAIYVGPGDSFATLTNVGADFTTNYIDDGQPDIVVSNVVPGTKFFIALDGYLGASGAAHINISAVAGPINANLVAVTNSTPVVAFSSPAANALSSSSNIVVKGTAKATGGGSVSYVQISVNGGAFGSATLTGGAWTTNLLLAPGANVITAQAISLIDSNNGYASLPVTRTIFYNSVKPSPKVTDTVTVLISGSGAVKGVANNAKLEIGKVYTATAVPGKTAIFEGWNTGTDTNSLTAAGSTPALAFLMQSNLILQATFTNNPFTNYAGSYNGLFSPAGGVSEASSGFLTATLPATGKGTYSAKVMLDGGTYPMSGTFDLAGDAQQFVARAGKPSLAVGLHLDLSSNNDLLTGSVSEVSTNGWTSALTADRAVFNSKSNPATNFTGKYTLILPPGDTAPTNEPGGYGYATLSGTSAGQMSLSGDLADKTAISQSVPISKDGNVPVYVSLYSHKGLLIGWLTLTNSGSSSPADLVSGSGLAWIKTNIPRTLYTAGFTNTNVTVLGTLYTAPKGNVNNFTLTNGTLTLSNGDLVTPLVYSNLSITGDKLISPTAGTLGTITGPTGAITVTVKNGNKTISAKGVVLQGTSDTGGTNAAGWFLGTDQSGFFLLQQ
jgi:hypothetical protein